MFQQRPYLIPNTMKWGKILILVCLLAFSGCRSTHAPDQKKLEKLEDLYKVIYDLYQKLGYKEIDSINKVYDTLDQQITFFADSIGNGLSVSDYRKLEKIHSNLYNYLHVSNSFNEEIFTLEDNISRLEYYIRSGKMSDSLFYVRFDKESQELYDLADRINDKRKIVLNSISSYYRIKPQVDKVINTGLFK